MILYLPFVQAAVPLLKNDHPKYGSDLNVMDISEFLVENKLDTDKNE